MQYRPSLARHFRNCYCGDFDSLDPIVICTNCGKWYHSKCVKLSPNDLLGIKALRCNLCANRLLVPSIPFPKCRLDSCGMDLEHRIDLDTSYQGFCSKDHQAQFWQGVCGSIKNSRNAAALKNVIKLAGNNFPSIRVVGPGIWPYPRDVSTHPEYAAAKARIDNFKLYREQTQLCGFNSECNLPIESCKRHENWLKIEERKLDKLEVKLANLDSKAPSKKYMMKRKRALVTGSSYEVAYAPMRAYIQPHIWHDNATSYLINGDPRPFWRRYF